MPTISELKERPAAQTPLVVFDCVLLDGRVERWSTHAVTVDGNAYEARVLGHTLFEIQTATDQGVDSIPKISLVLANADSHFSELEREMGWKGARLTGRFVFFDLQSGQTASESVVLFQGLANPPEEITEATFRLSAMNRLSMQRVLLPEVRIQRRCPWEFPATREQREEGVNGGEAGRYSRFYRCGYSPDVEGGQGTLDGDQPFTACAYTRGECQARGMTTRFGGLEFVPPSITVRSYGEKGSHVSAVSNNEARYNDFVPVVYGTAWYNPPVVFARNDGNLTRMEVLLGMGPMEAVVKILVNGVEIPAGRAGTNMTGTGWYNAPTMGGREGAFDTDFTDSNGQPAGDPYGSMAYLSVVVPNRISDGRSLPSVKALVHGLKLPVYGTDGALTGEQFTNNPAWVLLDLLRRSGWSTADIDVSSFAQAAAASSELIDAVDVYGNPAQVPRFECNLTLQTRRSAGDAIRGIRNGSRLYLTYGSCGKLELRMENTLALQQPVKPEGSNSSAILDNGWPAYEFGDGTNGCGGILRRENGMPALRVWSRATTDTPNRFSVEFQDSLNDYQQDSFSLVDMDDLGRAGQEISAALPALGLGNYNQAARVLRFQLDKTIRGNTYVEFETSVKAFGLKPGDVMALTYLKEGFERQPFRVLKIAPGTNYRTAKITAQIHDDAWYQDSAVGGASGGRPGETGIGLPRPLMGTTTDEYGDVQFGEEQAQVTPESVTLAVSFLTPAKASANGPHAPLVSLAPRIETGGTLAGGQNLYYAVSGVDANGQEGPFSFVVRASIPGGNNYAVTLVGLSFAPGTVTFSAYRGVNPSQMFRIASNQNAAATFTDTGFEKQLYAPRDANFDHANFYWRMEMQPEHTVSLHGGTSVGESSLQMKENGYRGMVARITRGKGAGQERVISSNTATTVTVAPAWDLEPNTTSFFAVAESGWHFAASAQSSPVQFDVPNRGGMVVEVCGRAANVNDVECPLELSTVTRWMLNAGAGRDSDVPPAPEFGLGLLGQGGGVELAGVGFTDLTNTRTVSAGTLTLRYWDEVGENQPVPLADAVSDEEEWLTLASAGPATTGAFVQIEGEVMRVEEATNGGARLRVTRGADGSEATSHAAQTPVYALLSKTVVAPFSRDFFGSPASGSWSFPVPLPHARVAGAELFLTNELGNGAAGSRCVTGGVDYGIRTVAGGQYTLQVAGFLSVDSAAAPAMIVESNRSVKDVFAILGAPADAAVQLRITQDGAPYCELTIPARGTISGAVNGFGLPRLNAGAHLELAVLAVGTTQPGADLTVVIRL